MIIYKQQILLITLFVIAILLLAFLALAAWKNSSSLSAARTRAQHSDEIVSNVRELQQHYIEADLCGRLAIAKMNHCALDEKRGSTVHRIERLVNVIGDNRVQQDNVSSLRDAIQLRFDTQDRVKNLSSTDGTFVIPMDDNILLIQASANVERAFNNLQAQEYTYLRQRHQDLNLQESSFNRLVFWIVFLALLVFLSSAWFGNRLLLRTKRANQQLRNQINNTPDDTIIHLHKQEFEDIMKILRGEV